MPKIAPPAKLAAARSSRTSPVPPSSPPISSAPPSRHFCIRVSWPPSAPWTNTPKARSTAWSRLPAKLQRISTSRRLPRNREEAKVTASPSPFAKSFKRFADRETRLAKGVACSAGAPLFLRCAICFTGNKKEEASQGFSPPHLPLIREVSGWPDGGWPAGCVLAYLRSEEHTSELQSLAYLVCRLLLEKKNRARRV